MLSETKSLEDYVSYYLKNKNNSIEQNRTAIIKSLEKLNETKITEKQISVCFHMIDKLYFGNTISKKIDNLNKIIYFKVNNLLTKSAGRLGSLKYYYVLELSSKILDNLFNNQTKTVELGGLICYNLAETICVVIEHEIIHLILMMLYSIRTHNNMFRTLARNIFNQTQIRHKLLFGDITKHEQKISEMRDMINIGDIITCNNKFKGKIVDIKKEYVVIKISDIKYKTCPLDKLTIDKKKDVSIENLINSLQVGQNLTFRGDTYVILEKFKTSILVENVFDGKKLKIKYWALL